jgi:hypothetical protein
MTIEDRITRICNELTRVYEVHKTDRNGAIKYCLNAIDEIEALFNDLKTDDRIVIAYTTRPDKKVTHQGLIYKNIKELQSAFPVSRYLLVEKSPTMLEYRMKQGKGES